TGNAVVYDAGPGNTAIGGLTNGNTYYVSVQADGTIRLYDNLNDANNDAGNFKVLTSNGSGTDQKFITVPAVQSAVTFNPNGTTQATVTLKAGQGSVGQNAGSMVIQLPPPVTGFTTPQLLALAIAERTDVQFLGADPVHATVNFSGNTITRTDASNWSSLSV